MKAIARTWREPPEDLRRWVEPRTQLFVTTGSEYEVFAVSVYEGTAFFLVIDDLDTPVFLAAWLFEVSDPVVPASWICNVNLGNEVTLVAGPEFIAKDLKAYNRMVDQEIEIVEKLRRSRQDPEHTD